MQGGSARRIRQGSPPSGARRARTARTTTARTRSASASPSKAKAKEKKADEQDQEDATEFKNAAKECASERTADADTFKTTYGTEGSNFKNAFGKCVSQKVREDNDEETQQPTS